MKAILSILILVTVGVMVTDGCIESGKNPVVVLETSEGKNRSLSCSPRWRLSMSRISSVW